MKSSAADKVADQLNMKLFNWKKGFSCQFIEEQRNHFEPLRNFHKHKVLLHVLNQEFSVEIYKQKGLIVDHFPLHSFPEIQLIRNAWKKEKCSTIFDPLKTRASWKDLRPYNSIAFYYGCDVAFYLSFNCVYTSWLLLLAILGIVFYILSYVIKDSHGANLTLNNFLTPIYVILVSIWITIAFEKWKRREYELAFAWNTLDSKINRIERPEYKGKYIIDNVSKLVREQDTFPTNKRIWVITIPLLLIGAALIIANFVLFVYLSEKYVKDPSFQPFEKLFYTGLIGAGNGGIIFFFTLIYNFMCEKAVKWENHRFENTQETSLVLKTFIFDFLIAYLNLFYYGFIERNFALLASNFTSIVIMKNLLFNLKTHLIPYILFKIKAYLFKRKWKILREKIKKKIFEELQIDLFVVDHIQAFKELKPETQEKLLKEEKELLIQEQVHFSMIMNKLPNMRLVWTNYAIQFGYIAFFSMSFPLAPFIGLLLNLFDLYFSYFSLTNHIQRKPAVEKSNIGIWNKIFSLMSYVSLIVNLLLLALDPKGLLELLIRLAGDNHQVTSIFGFALLLVAVEHIMFLIKYLIDLAIDDKPQWVEEEIRKRNNLAYLEEEKLKRKYVKIKSEKKMKKKTQHIKKSLFAEIKHINNEFSEDYSNKENHQN